MLKMMQLLLMETRRTGPNNHSRLKSWPTFLKIYTVFLVLRNDLKMGKGKIAARCSHATLGLCKKILHWAPKALKRWEMCGQVKVVVKIEGEADMLVLQVKAKALDIPTHIVIDAGRTQIAPRYLFLSCFSRLKDSDGGSRTC